MATAPLINLKVEQSLLLSEWKSIKEQIEALSKRELELRNDLIDELSDPEKSEGSQTIAIGNGYKLEIKKPVNYTANALSLQEVEKFCRAAHLDQVYEDLFRWKPEVNLKFYNTLPTIESVLKPAIAHKLHKLISDCITIKPGQASLKLVEP